MGSAAENPAERAEVIQKFRVHGTDCGSPEVQVALLTKRIEKLSQHSSTHPHDVSSNRGLLAMVSQRKRLLQYLKGESVERYKIVIGALGLRK